MVDTSPGSGSVVETLHFSTVGAVSSLKDLRFELTKIEALVAGLNTSVKALATNFATLGTAFKTAGVAGMPMFYGATGGSGLKQRASGVLVPDYYRDPVAPVVPPVVPPGGGGGGYRGGGRFRGGGYAGIPWEYGSAAVAGLNLAGLRSTVAHGLVRSIGFGSFGLGAGVIGVGGAAYAASRYAQFEEGMALIEAANLQDSSGLGRRIRGLAGRTPYNPRQYADASLQLARQGYSNELTGNALEVAGKLAKISGGNITDIARQLGSLVSAYNIAPTLENYKLVGDKLAFISAQSPATIPSLMTHVRYLPGKLGIAGWEGFSALDEAFLQLTAEGKAGIFGTIAARAFGTGYLRALTPKPKYEGVLKELGISLRSPSDPSKMASPTELARSFAVGLSPLSDSTQIQILKDIFGFQSIDEAKRLMVAMHEGLGSGNFGKVAPWMAKASEGLRLNNVTGQLEKRYERWEKTIMADWTKMTSAWDEWWTDAGATIEVPVRAVLKSATELPKLLSFSSLNSILIGGMTGFALGGPAGAAVGAAGGTANALWGMDLDKYWVPHVKNAYNSIVNFAKGGYSDLFPDWYDPLGSGEKEAPVRSFRDTYNRYKRDQAEVDSFVNDSRRDNPINVNNLANPLSGDIFYERDIN